MAETKCIVPWIHIHRSPTGNFTPCCKIRSSYIDFRGSREEYWNSEELKQMRLTLAAGEFPKGCEDCGTNVAGPAYRQMFFNLAKREKFIPEITKDGSVTQAPISFLVRSDLCNLACQICTPQNSTSIAALYRTIPISKNPDVLTLSDEDLLSAKAFHWTGGEPVISPEHWSLMGRLVSLGNTKLSIHYNSNLVFAESMYSKWLELLPKFSNVELDASCDGVGPIGSYVRHGIDEDLFFRRLFELVGKVKALRLSITVTNIGMICLPVLIEKTLTLPESIKISLNCVQDKGYLDVRSLRKDYVFEQLEKTTAIARGSRHEASVKRFVTFLETHMGAEQYPAFSRAELNEAESRRGVSGFFDSHMLGLLRPDLEQPYCIAPWVSSHVSSTGRRSVCCVINEGPKAFQDIPDFDEYWNSPLTRELRLDMLAHKPPKECHVCISGLRSSSMAVSIKNAFKHVDLDITNNTDSTGRTTLQPKMFEVKHIACNLTCRHCSPSSSSALRASFQKKSIPIVPLSSMYVKSKLENTDLDRVDASTQSVLWAGGEPFMSPLLPKYLQIFLDKGLTHVKQSMVTNLMFRPAQGTVELLSKFDSVFVNVSLDGLGRYGKFQRTGFDEAVFLDNLNYLKAFLPKTTFRVSFTLTCVSALSLPETVRFCLANKLEFMGFKMTSYATTYLDANLLRWDVLEPLLAEAVFLMPQGVSTLVKDAKENYEATLWTEEHQESLIHANLTRTDGDEFFALVGGKLNA